MVLWDGAKAVEGTYHPNYIENKKNKEKPGDLNWRLKLSG